MYNDLVPGRPVIGVTIYPPPWKSKEKSKKIPLENISKINILTPLLTSQISPTHGKTHALLQRSTALISGLNRIM